ncbi:DNA-directed RNA polymerase I subunit RPA34 [Nycticebus coucang]|uniref:DNA-directed RNA polymerase I subunit RPA34 n=1 Tax=Nycticebus coucang TaxID=9470 RepID=UPI00234C2AAD|nr:DNA-directed RNA polymerase I subunit RPA34 [Nycticebus coucang]
MPPPSRVPWTLPDKVPPFWVHVVCSRVQVAVAAGSTCSVDPRMERAQSNGAARFSCPPNFAATQPASESPRFSLEALTGPDTELWLIQAPAEFTPDCLNGRRVPLSGSQTVKGKLAGKRHRYRVLSSTQAGETTLLAPSAEVGGGLICALAPRGCLRIIEGPQESLLGTPLQPIPASPPPQIPPGLKPRFCAFGGNPPVTGPGSALAHNSPTSGKRKKKMQIREASVTQEAVNGYGALQMDRMLLSPEIDVEKKKKKKKKKQQLNEPMAEMLETPGMLFPSTTEKQQPKAAETFEPEEKTVELKVIKTEPLEEIVLSPTKKRKRPKETKGMQPVEGMTVETQMKMAPQEEAISLSPVKKRKKEKWQNAMTEPGTKTVEPEMNSQELPGEMIEPELPKETEPQVEAALVSIKKKKEKRQNVMTEPGTEVAEPELAVDLVPQSDLASTKRRKKERGHKVTELMTEMIAPPRETMEPETKAAPGSTKRRKKRSQEGEKPETASPKERPEVLLNLESGEVTPIGGQEKKRKKLQQDAM